MRLDGEWPLQSVNGCGRKAAYEVTGNVIWLTRPAKCRDFQRADALASLRRNVTRLIGEVERSGQLKADIAAAIDARRYELYRRSAILGARASDRGLAAAQRAHVGNLLRFLHAIAATRCDRAFQSGPADRLDPLARSLRDLEASVMRARRLSQDVLTQCQRPDRREFAPLGPGPAGDDGPRTRD